MRVRGIRANGNSWHVLEVHRIAGEGPTTAALPMMREGARPKVSLRMHSRRGADGSETVNPDPKCRSITDGILKSRRKFVSFDRVSARLDWQALVRHPLTHGVVVNGDIRLPPPTRHRVEQRRPLPRPTPGGAEAVEGVAAGIRVL